MRFYPFAPINGIMAMLVLGFGYVICWLAKKEKGVMKKMGYIIGGALIIISAVIVIAKILLVLRIAYRPPMNMPMQMQQIPGPEMPRK